MKQSIFCFYFKKLPLIWKFVMLNFIQCFFLPVLSGLPSQTLREYLVCVICSWGGFHSILCKLYIVNAHTENTKCMYLLFWTDLTSLKKSFKLLSFVLFVIALHGGYIVCIICYCKFSFNIIQTLHRSVHTLKICT